LSATIWLVVKAAICAVVKETISTVDSVWICSVVNAAIAEVEKPLILLIADPLLPNSHPNQWKLHRYKPHCSLA
jgi:hypothetical protein